MSKHKDPETKPKESKYQRKVRARRRYLQRGEEIVDWREGRKNGTIKID